MAWLLFLDESGHDHKQMPYEVRGGVAIQDDQSEPVREEIRYEFEEWIRRLQFHGDGEKEGRVFQIWGICYVPNPCSPGRDELIGK